MAESEYIKNDTKAYASICCSKEILLTIYDSYRNTASETVKQKLVYAGTEEGKLIALRQRFAEVSSLVYTVLFKQVKSVLLFL